MAAQKEAQSVRVRLRKNDTVKVIISQARDGGVSYLKTNIVDTVTGSEVVRLPSGEYKLTLGSQGNEFEANKGGFTLRRGNIVVVKVTRKESRESKPESKSVPPMTLPAMAQTKLSLEGSKLSEGLNPDKATENLLDASRS